MRGEWDDEDDELRMHELRNAPREGGGTMKQTNYGCPKCNVETGGVVRLEETMNGVLICPSNQNHRYLVDENGFLKAERK